MVQADPENSQVDRDTVQPVAGMNSARWKESGVELGPRFRAWLFYLPPPDGSPEPLRPKPSSVPRAHCSVAGSLPST